MTPSDSASPKMEGGWKLSLLLLSPSDSLGPKIER